MKRNKKVECRACKNQEKCCRLGAWVDLGEAKKILALGIKGGDFFHLEKDDDYPSGYRVGTSVEDEPCSFITRDGLCAIHKIDYNLKPAHCREFPYEKGRLSSIAKYLCVVVRARRKKSKEGK
ncbi:MAG: YkgJ family cysteine cluster protein [Candidatus Omnitrophica bacterium]|nr:YkgJ family cysteine cluster protein [Candidatus Omnitrophota bacterium]MDD5592812.1 YkgJ family cysteine cluster protein [Candidatus Omnitrophota bacterium]